MRKVTLRILQSSTGADQITLHFGQASRLTSVARPDDRTLQLPPDVMRDWCLVPGQTLRVWRTPDGRHLHLGPLFGVVFEEPEPEVAEIRVATVQALGEASQQEHVPLLCFSMHAVDIVNGTVTGLLYRSGRHWQEAKLPIPDVIYNRATYPDLTKRQEASAMRQRLRKQLGVPFINPVAGFSKWDVHEALLHFPTTRRHTPATTRLESAWALRRFLRYYPDAFVKHDQGTWGQSVLKVSAAADGYGPFRVFGYARDLPVSATFPAVGELYDYLTSMPGGSGWIAQQAIALLKVDGRPFDLRLVLQKDGRGRWQVAQRLVNWAGPGDVVTNHRSTAEFVPADEFQHRWADGRSAFAKLVDSAVQVGRRCVQALEAHYGLFGEIGLDIGFDQDGHAWVFEANAKPFLAPGIGITYPFAYARYLAKRFWRACHGVM